MAELTVGKRPCGSCPYRRDVPSGIWDRREYEKLIEYDNETWQQPLGVFMCHQRDGSVCAGWLACHGADGPFGLMALRVAAMGGEDVPAELFAYSTDVPVFNSAQEAHDHGVAEIDKPGADAKALIGKLTKVL